MRTIRELPRAIYPGVLWSAVWTRPALDRRTRSVINLAMITALNRPHELNHSTEVKLRDVPKTYTAGFGLRLLLEGVRTAVALSRATSTPTPLGDVHEASGGGGREPARGRGPHRDRSLGESCGLRALCPLTPGPTR